MEHSEAWAMRASHNTDSEWSLDQLIKLIHRTKVPFPLGVLMSSGVVIKGLAVHVDRWAEHLDAAMDRYLARAAEEIAREQQDLTVDDLASVRGSAGDVERRRSEWIDQGWQSLVAREREQEADTRARLAEIQGEGEDPDLTELPDDLAANVVSLNVSAQSMTIADVELVSFGGPSVRLVMVRVAVPHIAAWWPTSLPSSTEGS